MGRKRPRGERVAFDISADATNALAHVRDKHLDETAQAEAAEDQAMKTMDTRHRKRQRELDGIVELLNQNRTIQHGLIIGGDAEPESQQATRAAIDDAVHNSTNAKAEHADERARCLDERGQRACAIAAQHLEWELKSMVSPRTVTMVRAPACDSTGALQPSGLVPVVQACSTFLCVECPAGAKRAASHKGVDGRWNILCASHAKAAGTYIVRYPCIKCQKHASQRGLDGRANQLCTAHAKEAGTYTVPNPCTKCPIGANVGASFNGPDGRAKQLCTAHAKEAGTYTVRTSCTKCPIGANVWASFKGADGRKNQLCGPHAKEAGTYTVRTPCTKCPIGANGWARFKGADGRTNQLCGPHAREAGAYEPPKRPQCANCGCDARYRFSAESKFADEHACLPCLSTLDKGHPIVMRKARELKCIGAIVHMIAELGRPDIANTIKWLGRNDCPEGPSRRRGDHVFPIITTLVGQLEVDEDNHRGYSTSCETAKVAGHICDRNGIDMRSVDAGEGLDKAQIQLIDDACDPSGAGATSVNTHVWRVDPTGAFIFHQTWREWVPIERVFLPLMLRVATSIVACFDSVTPIHPDPQPSAEASAVAAASAVAMAAAVAGHPLWKVEYFGATQCL